MAKRLPRIIPGQTKNSPQDVRADDLKGLARQFNEELRRLRIPEKEPLAPVVEQPAQIVIQQAPVVPPAAPTPVVEEQPEWATTIKVNGKIIPQKLEVQILNFVDVANGTWSITPVFPADTTRPGVKLKYQMDIEYDIAQWSLLGQHEDSDGNISDITGLDVQLLRFKETECFTWNLSQDTNSDPSKSRLTPSEIFIIEGDVPQFSFRWNLPFKNIFLPGVWSIQSWTRTVMTHPELIEFGTFDGTTFTCAKTGIYHLHAMHAQDYLPDVAIEPRMAVFVNGIFREDLAMQYLSISMWTGADYGFFELNGGVHIYLQENDLMDVRINTRTGNIVPDLTPAPDVHARRIGHIDMHFVKCGGEITGVQDSPDDLTAQYNVSYDQA